MTPRSHSGEFGIYRIAADGRAHNLDRAFGPPGDARDNVAAEDPFEEVHRVFE
ncbi:MAG TPA: hypothetical protein VFY40_12065 [Blastocatellia bacterium]|nr:hypothetical protein [Blastocatellia bacterium]